MLILACDFFVWGTTLSNTQSFVKTSMGEMSYKNIIIHHLKQLMKMSIQAHVQGQFFD